MQPCDVVTLETAVIDVVGLRGPVPQLDYRNVSDDGNIYDVACDNDGALPERDGVRFYCDGGQSSGHYTFTVRTGTVACSYERRIDVPETCGRPLAFWARVSLAPCEWEILEEGF